jgi:ankyrin repeat protein
MQERSLASAAYAGDTQRLRDAIARYPQHINKRVTLRLFDEDTLQMTPLLYAVHANKPAAVLELLRSGADPNIGSHGDISVLEWAMLMNSEAAAVVFVENGGPVLPKTTRGPDTLEYAAFRDMPNLVRALLLRLREGSAVFDISNSSLGTIMHRYRDDLPTRDSLLLECVRSGLDPNAALVPHGGSNIPLVCLFAQQASQGTLTELVSLGANLDTVCDGYRAYEIINKRGVYLP